jgi:NitT/TauT family transport system permease protein
VTRSKTSENVFVAVIQVAIIAAFLAGWQWLPTIPALANSHILDRFFISSPSQVYNQLVDLANGHGGVLVWPFLRRTMEAALAGVTAGLLTGGLAGLVCSHFRIVGRIVRPFMVAMNAVPRIALIPVMVILFGITFKTSFASSIMIIFFIAFFNAYEGGCSVPIALIYNAGLLGASDWELMRYVRLPYVMAWTLATLPLAMTYSLLAVVTTEVLDGYAGIGALLSEATSTIDARLTYAVVVILAIVGLIVVGLAELVKRRVLHWWTVGQ